MLRFQNVQFTCSRWGPKTVSSCLPNVFVCGPLASGRVLKRLLGRVPVVVPASVSGWRKVAVQGDPFPGLVRHEHGTSTGHVLVGLTERELSVLDLFEHPRYEAVGVVPNMFSTDCKVFLYAVPDGFDEVTEWNRPEDDKWIEDCLTRCNNFAAH